MSVYNSYWCREWGLKHKKTINELKGEDIDEDIMRELFNELDMDKSNYIEYKEFLNMLRILKFNIFKSNLPEYFGFIGYENKKRLSYNNFKEIIISNKCIY